MSNKLATLAICFALGLGTAAQAATARQDRDRDKDDQAKHAQKAPKVKITHGPVVESTGPNTATIAWSTNVNGSTILKYGTNPSNLDRTAEAPWGGVTHRVHLKNLKPGTTYYYRVESTQAQGTGSQVLSSVEGFKTKGSEAAAAQPAQAQAAAPQYSQSELENFDNFLDAHEGIKAQLTRNPALVNDPNYLRQHPDLAQFLQTHKGVQAQLRANPSAFIRSESSYSGTEDRNTALQNFHQFLATHAGVRAELQSNPGLAKDPNYLAKHPALAQFLQAHKGVRYYLQTDPAGFMQSEKAMH